jgi:hypothetical protein
MKHWLAIGGIIIGAVVFFARSRISNQSAVPPTTAPGVSVDQLPARFRPTTSSATLPATRPAGITLDKLPTQYVPIPTH